jgi:multiple sugar transport system substrate-binding protein
LASEYYNFPCFAQTVPDLKELVAYDKKAQPPDKYKVLEDVLDWATNVGYPGYANAAIDEIFSTWIISTMFARVAAGRMNPQEAVNAADKKCKAIFEKWRAKGLA